MIDTGIDSKHPLLAGRRLTTRSLLPAGVRSAPPDHGTATAALLIGNTDASGFAGLLPDAQLYAANVFRSRGRKDVDTTAEWIVVALDWLAGEKVQVINLSLGGPRNLLVEAAVRRLLERGVGIVAAAGNGGASAPPVYPAAQPGVIATTAVDAKLKVYRKANRGDYIRFAAPGVDVWTAAPGQGGVYVSGTSYATPFVTAALAAAGARPEAIKGLERRARDLGDAGRDPVYGVGLIQAPAACGPAAPKSARKK
jgi:subtilisin family serine protease